MLFCDEYTGQQFLTKEYTLWHFLNNSHFPVSLGVEKKKSSGSSGEKHGLCMGNLHIPQLQVM